MNVLSEVLSVSLSPQGEKWDPTKFQRVLIQPRQILYFDLTISFENLRSSKDAPVRTFLSAVGEINWDVVWDKLFRRIKVLPFLESTVSTENSSATDDEDDVNSSVYSAGDQSRTQVLSEGDAPLSVPPQGPLQLSPRRSTQSSSTNSLVKEVAAASQSSITTDRNGPSKTTAPRPVFVFGGCDVLRVARQKGPFMSDTESTPTRFGKPLVLTSTKDVRNPPTGTTTATSAATTTAAAAAKPSSSSSSPAPSGLPPLPQPPATTTTSTALTPVSLSRTFTIVFTVPDWDAAEEEERRLDLRHELGFLVELDIAPEHHILRRVLTQEFLPCESVDTPLWLYNPPIVLGSYYVPVRIHSALQCRSDTSPLRNDQLVLSLALTNTSERPLVLHGASFDIYSTRRKDPEEDVNGGGRSDVEQPAMAPFWVEYRQGPSGAGMRTIDILTKVVTVTPMIVSHDRPPFVLQPGETYSFQFVVQVLPQLSFLLNQRSLEHVYAVRMANAAAASHKMDATNAPTTLKLEAPLIKDFSEKKVEARELVSVLSSSYVTQTLVYYALSEDPTQPQTILSRRHATPWSFGA